MRGRIIFAGLLVMLLSGASFAAEPATVPAESQVIRTNLNSPGNSAGDPLSPSRVAWSLAIVIAIILALRFAAKRYLPGFASPRGNGVMRVLLRTPIAPRQQVLILQIGQRLIVVGDSGQQMNTLCEITDPQEVAEMLAQLGGENLQAKSLPSAEMSRVNPDLATTRAELSGLLSKVQAMSKQFRPN